MWRPDTLSVSAIFSTGTSRRSASSSGDGRRSFSLLLKLRQGLAYLVERTHLIERGRRTMRLCSGKGLQDRLTDPPHGVGNKFKTTCLVKLLRCFNQAEISFIDKVGKAKTLILVLLRPPTQRNVDWRGLACRVRGHHPGGYAGQARPLLPPR